MISNILASLAAVLLLGFFVSSNNQSFLECFAQSQNTNNQSNDAGKMSTSELGSPNDISQKSLSNVQRVINELGNATSYEVATYPINDLSPDLLVKALNGLSVQSLYKVLRNLPHDQLKILLVDKLTPQESKQILDRLPQQEKTDIQNKSKF
jgi:hypothetical protein